MAMYLEEARLAHRSGFRKFLFSTTKNTKLDNSSFQLIEYEMHFEWI